jgi:diguanylate cyclase (GGDEF)-like protein
MRASQSLLALIFYALFAVLQQVEVHLGLIDPVESDWVMGAFLVGALLFYAVIRTGLNERFASDPSLTLAQTTFGIAISVAAYAITGPARGGVLTLLVLILVFTMFSMRPIQARGVALFAITLLAAVMLWKAHSDPARYPPAIEAIHFVFAAIVVSGVSVLAGRMGAMRARLQEQKLELQRAVEQIGQLATRDELTGLVNRRHMATLMQTEQARQRRDASKMTLAMLDIDHFKRINDNHGHQAGDAVLKAFAEVSRNSLRGTDVLARWGGEEFLLMLPATNPQQALRSIERLREGVARLSFDTIAAGLTVTFSAGLSPCDDDAPMQACIERADQAMYKAKVTGRNRSVLA